MPLPNEATYAELNEFEQQMQASHWAILFLLSETAAGFHVLVDKLTAKGVLDDDDAKEMDDALLNMEYMQRNYSHIQRAFQEKYNRVRFAASNPEEVTKFVEKKKAGEDPVDPLQSAVVDLNEITLKTPPKPGTVPEDFFLKGT